MRETPLSPTPHIGRARSMALAVIAIGCSLALFAGPEGVRPWATVSAEAGEARGVTIDNYSFTPSTLTIRAGTTVTWTNRDSEVHTVVADDAAAGFKSAGLDTDDSFSFTFDKVGSYSYHCSLHPHMTGKIIVQ